MLLNTVCVQMILKWCYESCVRTCHQARLLWRQLCAVRKGGAGHLERSVSLSLSLSAVKAWCVSLYSSNILALGSCWKLSEGAAAGRAESVSHFISADKAVVTPRSGHRAAQSKTILRTGQIQWEEGSSIILHILLEYCDWLLTVYSEIQEIS